MSSFNDFICVAVGFQQGFGIAISGILGSERTIFQGNKAQHLFKMILITILVIYIITIPIRISLLILQFIMSMLSFTKFANLLMAGRLSITFFNIFSDVAWYFPLFILFLSRSLRLFPSAPFDKAMMDKDHSFASQLSRSDTKQTAFNGTAFILKRIMVLVPVSVLIFISRFVPAVRILLSLFILAFVRLRSTKHHHNTDNINRILITLSLSMLLSNTFARLLLYAAKLYITSQALSREFLFPYFCKITPKMEKKDKRNHRWLLFGFGCAMTLCFSIPIVGLILYPVFQMSAAEVLMVMRQENKLSFTVMKDENTSLNAIESKESDMEPNNAQCEEVILNNKTQEPSKANVNENIYQKQMLSPHNSTSAENIIKPQKHMTPNKDTKRQFGRQRVSTSPLVLLQSSSTVTYAADLNIAKEDVKVMDGNIRKRKKKQKLNHKKKKSYDLPTHENKRRGLRKRRAPAPRSKTPQPWRPKTNRVRTNEENKQSDVILMKSVIIVLTYFVGIAVTSLVLVQ